MAYHMLIIKTLSKVTNVTFAYIPLGKGSYMVKLGLNKLGICLIFLQNFSFFQRGTANTSNSE